MATAEEQKAKLAAAKAAMRDYLALFYINSAFLDGSVTLMVDHLLEEACEGDAGEELLDFDI